MLKSLHIQNYVLIEDLELDFQDGFSAITGETGAGKSILLGALGLLLGERADLSSIGDKKCKTIIEGVFDVENLKLNNFFDQNKVDREDTLVIRRMLYPEGKSRAFVNDVPVKLEVLKDLSHYVIDVHSQHQNLDLKSHQFQLSLIDGLAETGEVLERYQRDFAKYQSVLGELEQFKENLERDTQQLDFYQHQLDRFEALEAESLDLSELEQQLQALDHGEALAEHWSHVGNWLDGGDGSVLHRLDLIGGELKSIEKLTHQPPDLSERVESAFIELQDIKETVVQRQASLDQAPGDQEALRAKMSLVYQLFEVFRVQSVEALLEKKESLEIQVEAIISGKDKVLVMEKMVEDQRLSLEKIAQRLSVKRSGVFPRLESLVLSYLASLGMANSKFKVEQKNSSKININGLDEIEFLFSANAGQPMNPIAKVASGGEIARIMLALKVIMARNKNLPTIIFDEIDTGVSGDLAAKMGEIMQQMAQDCQVLVITHLPQIAAQAQHQLQVSKEVLLGKTVSSIAPIEKSLRHIAIAQMLGGEKDSTALEHAQSLLEKAKSS